jgi:hypothetical protein
VLRCQGVIRHSADFRLPTLTAGHPGLDINVRDILGTVRARSQAVAIGSEAVATCGSTIPTWPAAAETVMFGGSDSSSSAAIPQHIVIRNSVLTKNPAWYRDGRADQNAFELKSAIDVPVSTPSSGTRARPKASVATSSSGRSGTGQAPWLDCAERPHGAQQRAS